MRGLRGGRGERERRKSRRIVESKQRWESGGREEVEKENDGREFW